MSRNKFARNIAAGFVAVTILFQLGCTKKDQQGRVDFYIDITNGSVSSTNGSGQTQIANYYQELYITGGEVYVNGIIVFKGIYGNYYALSQYCPSDGCDVEYQVSYDRLQCPCDLSLFHVDGSVQMGPNSVPLYTYVATLNGSLLHVYTP